MKKLFDILSSACFLVASINFITQLLNDITSWPLTLLSVGFVSLFIYKIDKVFNPPPF